MAKYFSTSQTPIVDFRYKVPIDAIAMGLQGRQNTWNQEESLIDNSFKLVDSVKHLTGSLGEQYGDVEAAKSLQQKYDDMLEQGLAEIGNDYSKAGKLRRKIEQEISKDFGANGVAGALESRYASQIKREEYAQSMVKDGGWDNTDYQNYLSQGTPLETENGYNSNISGDLWSKRPEMHELLPDMVAKLPDVYKDFLKPTADGKWVVSTKGKTPEQIRTVLTGYLQSVPGFNEWFQRDLQAQLTPEHVTQAAYERVDMAEQFKTLLKAAEPNSDDAKYYQTQIDKIMDPEVSDEQFNLQYRAQQYINDLVEPYVEGFSGISDIDVRANPDYEHALRMSEINYKNQLEKQSLILASPLSVLDIKGEKASKKFVGYNNAKQSLEKDKESLSKINNDYLQKHNIQVEKPEEFMDDLTNAIKTNKLGEFQTKYKLSSQQLEDAKSTQDLYARTKDELRIRERGLANMESEVNSFVDAFYTSMATDPKKGGFKTMLKAHIRESDTYDPNLSPDENYKKAMKSILLGNEDHSKTTLGMNLSFSPLAGPGRKNVASSDFVNAIKEFQDEWAANREADLSKRIIGFTDLNKKSNLSQYTTLMEEQLDINGLKGFTDVNGNDAMSVIKAKLGVGDSADIDYKVQLTDSHDVEGNPLIAVSYTDKSTDGKSDIIYVTAPKQWEAPLLGVLQELKNSGNTQEASYAAQGLGNMLLKQSGVSEDMLQHSDEFFITGAGIGLKVEKDDYGNFRVRQENEDYTYTDYLEEFGVIGSKSDLKELLGQIVY